MWLEDSKRFPAKEKEFIGRLRRRSLLQLAEISHRTGYTRAFVKL
jgi:hypothetical protein